MLTQSLIFQTLVRYTKNHLMNGTTQVYEQELLDIIGAIKPKYLGLLKETDSTKIGYSRLECLPVFVTLGPGNLLATGKEQSGPLQQ